MCVQFLSGVHFPLHLLLGHIARGMRKTIETYEKEPSFVIAIQRIFIFIRIEIYYILKHSLLCFELQFSHFKAFFCNGLLLYLLILPYSDNIWEREMNMKW